MFPPHPTHARGVLDGGTASCYLVGANGSGHGARSVTIEARTSAETETRSFTASVYRDGEWHVAQALEVDIASHGRPVEEALDSLREALTLYFAPPYPGPLPNLHRIEVKK